MRIGRTVLFATLLALAAGATAGQKAAPATGAEAPRQPAAVAAPALTVQQAWARATPPGATVAAAYVTVRNAGTRPLVIVGVRSPVAGRASIHETRISGGSMQMRVRPELAVPPGGTVTMEPAGVHVMLEELKRPLAAGEKVPLELVLAGGGTVPVVAVVRPLG
jgi:copper(I)-binding protein